MVIFISESKFAIGIVPALDVGVALASFEYLFIRNRSQKLPCAVLERLSNFRCKTWS